MQRQREGEKENAIHDANMVEESRDNVDVPLVFAGLFSAVVTTFVVQTIQSLKADYAQISASLLFELVLLQRAIANGSTVDTVPASSLNPQTVFVSTAIDVWVNGLYFTRLFLSLTTALVAVLVKQWLHHYVGLPSGTPRNRCFVRQYRYLGFQDHRWPATRSHASGFSAILHWIVIVPSSPSNCSFMGYLHGNCNANCGIYDRDHSSYVFPAMSIPHPALRSHLSSICLHHLLISEVLQSTASALETHT
ncbi:uncharacterized protein BT62DRAFT_759911 [Guyanagaster necrorhizus]|uniref:DUF6535 domain-containing protein n=1 Tax=Guyanagaster necrorhizus TaxID=856835 RepID=A0A9P7VWX1_9AGAR|nr:uncharacterized protein BT62DRAFT_759911 [Guyanagaster necrorhizus MCA 3950]KAG7448225.1 hypothetical protein BT62DRAFT_759911 [Guyanagaster necrorhizus MCA 3950]